MENITTELLQEEEEIVIPPGRFSVPTQEKSKEEILEHVKTFLTLPKRAETENQDKDLPKALGEFLVHQEYIKNIGMHEESWVFEYNSENRTIYISEEEIPSTTWRDFFFRKQTTLEEATELFPMHPIYTPEGEKDELDIYRFLHETSHAYQEYLKDKESAENNFPPKHYFDNAVKEKITTPFAKLFSFCYSKRKKNFEKNSIIRGLSTWGGIQHYQYGENEEIKNQNSEHAVRSLEDANELVTMFLWHRKYFETYLKYLQDNFPTELYKRNLTKLEEEETEFLRDNVENLIEDMKKEIQYG